MEVRALGHAGLEVRHGGTRLVIDPWFSPAGAFQASWFPFPDNAHLVTDDLFTPAAVVLSHEHLDHLDPWFLSRVPRDVPVLIPRYPSPVLRTKVDAAGPRDRLIEMPPWERISIGDLEVMFVSEESPMNHDSAVVVTGGRRSVLNLNDARLSPVQLRAISAAVGGRVDVLALQGAGASWFPLCYEMPAAQRAATSRAKRAAKLAYTTAAMRVVNPVVGIPFAGPPCFLDPPLAVHNREMDGGIFPDQSQVIRHLEAEDVGPTALLLPGDEWDLESRARTADPAWEQFTFADTSRYIAAYAERRRPAIEAVYADHPHPEVTLWPSFEEYFRRLIDMSPYFNEQIAMRVGFDVNGPGGGQWSADFGPGQPAVLPTLDGCSYVYRLESRWLAPLLAGEVAWEDFLLSLRFSAWRDPDIYNDHLLGILKFADPDALAAVEAFETSPLAEAWITVHADGRSYRVQRFCPHAGNDLLESGEVLDGRVLRCLAHHYEFDLDTGTCVNGRCAPLRVELLGDDAARVD
jgi:UDP-MurNAc hydroxylase